MTAFNDILTIEDEATQSIETAKTAAADAVAEAHTVGQSRTAVPYRHLLAPETKA